MKIQLPPRLTQGLPLIVPDDWTAEQALAAFELLDELREQIWAYYGAQLQELLRDQRRPTNTTDGSNSEIDDDPF